MTCRIGSVAVSYIAILIICHKLNYADASRILKFGCNTSGISMVNMLCRVRSTSRITQEFNAGFELTRPLANLMLHMRSFYKQPTGIHWRQLVDLRRVNVCPLIGGKETSLPIINYLRNLTMQTAPFLPNEGCPVKIGKYYGYKMKFNNTEPTVSVESFMSPTALPNGIYRNVFRFYDDVDTNGFSFWVHVEKYEVANAENLMK